MAMLACPSRSETTLAATAPSPLQPLPGRGRRGVRRDLYALEAGAPDGHARTRPRSVCLLLPDEFVARSLASLGAGPILTMDQRTSAVLSGIFAGHSVPQGPQLWASWRAYLAARHSLIPFKVTASMIPAGRIVLTEVDRWTSFPRPSRRGPGRSAWGATEVATLWWWQRGSSVSREE
jgi:hypothetical protein